jgi:hypothetical protein
MNEDLFKSIVIVGIEIVVMIVLAILKYLNDNTQSSINEPPPPMYSGGSYSLGRPSMSILPNSPPLSQLVAIVSTAQINNVDTNDHIMFNRIMLNVDTKIGLDVLTPYVKTLSQPSIGRFSLKGGSTYRVKCTIEVVFWWPELSRVEFHIIDSSNGNSVSHTIVMNDKIRSAFILCFISPSMNGSTYEVNMGFVKYLLSINKATLEISEI